jgi:hypothetical protein
MSLLKEPALPGASSECRVQLNDPGRTRTRGNNCVRGTVDVAPKVVLSVSPWRTKACYSPPGPVPEELPPPHAVIRSVVPKARVTHDRWNNLRSSPPLGRDVPRILCSRQVNSSGLFNICRRLRSDGFNCDQLYRRSIAREMPMAPQTHYRYSRPDQIQRRSKIWHLLDSH